MKKYLLLILWAAASFAATAQDETKWCRPVKAEFDSTLVGTTDDKREILIFKDEWFVTEAEGKGNALLGEYILATDGKPSKLDYKQRSKLDGHSPLATDCAVTDDSIYIKVQSSKDAKWYYVIDQTNNALINKSNVFDKYVAYPKSKMKEIRISPQSHVSTVLSTKSMPVCKVSEYEEDGMIYEGIIIGECHIPYSCKGPVPVEPVKEEESSSAGVWIFIIIVLIIVLVIPVQDKVLNIFKKRKEKPDKEDGEAEGHEEHISQENDEKTYSDDNTQKNLSESKGGVEDNTQRKEEYESLEKKYRKEIDDEKRQRYEAEEKVKSIKKELETEFDKERQSLQQAKSDAVASLKDVEKILDETKTKLGQVQSELRESQADLKRTETELKSKEKSLYEAEESLRQTKSNLSETKDTLKETAEALTETQDTLSKTQGALAATQGTLKETQGTLATTQKTLKETEDKLDFSEKTVQRLEEAQRKFTDTLTFVPFAKDYTLKIKSLLAVVDKIKSSANRLLEIKVDDQYYIMKCIAKYAKAAGAVDLHQLYTEVTMVSEGQMVLNGTSLSTYNQKASEEELHNSLKIYFFDNYLSKYIDAAIVLCESCIGLDRFVPGLNESHVKQFIDYRRELETCCGDLEITVETVHLFDKVGTKIDLRVTQIGAGFAPGDILEIDNCLVYLTGSPRPATKVYVKAQM